MLCYNYYDILEIIIYYLTMLNNIKHYENLTLNNLIHVNIILCYNYDKNFSQNIFEI